MISSYRLYLIYAFTAALGTIAVIASCFLFIYGFIQFIQLSGPEDEGSMRAMLFMIWICVVFAVTCIFGVTGVGECLERMKGLVGEK